MIMLRCRRTPAAGVLALVLLLPLSACEFVRHTPEDAAPGDAGAMMAGAGADGRAAGAGAAGTDGTERIVGVFPDGVRPLAPYSPAIRAGGWLHLAGQVGLVPETGQLAEGGVAAELEQAIRNLEAILTEAGRARADLVSCTLYLVDIDDFAAVNEVWGAFVADPAPARTTVAVQALPVGAQIEVTCIAKDG